MCNIIDWYGGTMLHVVGLAFNFQAKTLERLLGLKIENIDMQRSFSAG